MVDRSESNQNPVKKEDQALEEINKQLRLEIAAAKAKLEQQQAIEKKFEESQRKKSLRKVKVVSKLFSTSRCWAIKL
jgi:hypothetical protein